VLVSIDAFRWDYLNRSITPALSQIKKEGVSAISLQPSFPSKTFPNHTSIITGMYPENHGIISNSFTNPYSNERYSMGDTVAVRDGKWYLGEAFWETAKRNGITSASFFWPGSEVLINYRHPDYYHVYNKQTTDKEKLDGVISWLNLPFEKRPHFITVYFEQVDTKAHDSGPDSKEINETIKEVDKVIMELRDRIAKTSLKDSVNIIVLSDHGMTNISKERNVNIEQIINDPAGKIINSGAIALIQTSKGKEKEIYEKIKKSENHYKVYYKNEVPGYLHYSKHPFIPEIVVIPDLGWQLTDNRSAKRTEAYGVKSGDHGYDNFQLDMHGIFIACGPAFKKHYATGTLLNVDIYPLLCKIFNIAPRQNIDGKTERIEFLLNNN
jgi:predicted AlkP superfamily pyrophosphatase or phosphodiesterase